MVAKIKDANDRTEIHENLKDLKILEKEMESMRGEFADMKETIALTATLQPVSPSRKKMCKKCREKFIQNNKLESQMVDFHGLEEKNKKM